MGVSETRGPLAGAERRAGELLAQSLGRQRMTSMKRLLFYSRAAFYRPLYMVFEQLCAEFGLDGFVISHGGIEVPRVYAPRAYFTPQSAGLAQVPDFVSIIPGGLSHSEKLALLKKKVQEIRPDFIWAHEEPTDPYVNEMLRWFYFRQTPRIIVSVVENLWRLGYGYRDRYARFRRRLLWARYNGVVACATKSLESIRHVGMPQSVPAEVAWLPHLPPPPARNSEVASFLPPRKEGEVFVGFAGRIMAGKGWRVLLAALAQLPENFKCLIAGTGDEEAELRLWCLLPALCSRVHYLGVFEKEELWDFYRALDIFVLPSVTTPYWTEQFGSVLAEAMSCGVPVIGSSSGAIPEVVGDCGLIVEENNPTALAKAICTLANDPLLRATYIERGLLHFEQEFSLKAYVARLAAALRLDASANHQPPGPRGRRVGGYILLTLSEMTGRIVEETTRRVAAWMTRSD